MDYLLKYKKFNWTKDAQGSIYPAQKLPSSNSTIVKQPGV